MPVNVLPDMDEPRLKALGKQLNRSRKSSIISHDKLKDELDVYKKSLNKEQRSIDGRFHTHGLRLKHKLARVRGTQKCLKQKREQSFFEDSEEYPFGEYQGESLHDIRRQVDAIIERKHPKYRRQRKVDRFLEQSKNRGRILEESDIKEQFDMIMNKEYDHRSKLSAYMRRENPLSLTFLNDQKNADEKVFWKSPNAPVLSSKTKVKSWLSCPGDSYRTPRVLSPIDSPSPRPHSDQSNPSFQISKSPRLNLPPITAKKELMNKRYKQEENTLSLPNLSIRRATKCDTLSKENLQKLTALKNRRMTTIA